jgi:hypothetical protein
MKREKELEEQITDGLFEQAHSRECGIAVVAQPAAGSGRRRRRQRRRNRLHEGW